MKQRASNFINLAMLKNTHQHRKEFMMRIVKER